MLDVLPGMYAPPAFVAELTRSLALADELARLAPAAHASRIARYHADATARMDAQWTALAGTTYLPGAVALVSEEQLAGALARAQRATMSKAYIEVPQLARLGFDAGSVPDDDAAWATIGQRLWQLGLDAPSAAERRPTGDDLVLLSATPVMRPGPTAPLAPAADRPRILDATTRALVAAVHNAGPEPADGETLERVIARLEQHLVADSAQNQLVLRRKIHAQLATGARALDDLNAWIYAEIFHTPASDPWLGLLPRTDFTGLPGDGARTMITAQR